LRFIHQIHAQGLTLEQANPASQEPEPDQLVPPHCPHSEMARAEGISASKRAGIIFANCEEDYGSFELTYLCSMGFYINAGHRLNTWNGAML
jgi:hypothetical protein